MTHFGFKEAGRPPLQNPFFRVEMQDAIQDHILVHRRLHLPLFFSAFCQSSPTVHRYPLFPWVEQDSERIIESQSTAILTPVQTHIYTYRLSRRLVVSWKFLSVYCDFSFLPFDHPIHGIVRGIWSQKHASVRIKGGGELKRFEEFECNLTFSCNHVFLEKVDIFNFVFSKR